MSEVQSCPTCGFPNPAGSHSCMACQSPLGVDSVAPSSTDTYKSANASLRRSRRASAGFSQPVEVASIYDPQESPETPEEILERIRRARGDDALRSLEMMAIPNLREAVESDLSSGPPAVDVPPPQPLSAPTPLAVTAREAPEAAMPRDFTAPSAGAGTFQNAPPSAGSSAPHPGSSGSPRSDPWMVDHHELRAVSARDPWASQYRPRASGPKTTHGTAAKSEFKLIDLVAAAGVAAILLSLLLPWVEVHGVGSEGETISPTAMPLAILLKGVAEDYPFEWLTAAVATVVLAVLATIGLAFPRSQAAVTGLTVAGMAAIVLPAALLLKLAIGGEVGMEGETAYVAAPGLYLALGAAVLLLAGAALRGGKARGR